MNIAIAGIESYTCYLYYNFTKDSDYLGLFNDTTCIRKEIMIACLVERVENYTPPDPSILTGSFWIKRDVSRRDGGSMIHI